MSAFNYESLIKRAEKLIKKIEDKGKASSIHIVSISDNIEKLSGLVVIMHPDIQLTQKQD